MKPTYLGTSEHALDDKGRLIVPGRILDQVPKAAWRFHLTAGIDRCLLMLDSEGWRELVDRLGQGVLSSRPLRSLRRRFLGHSEECIPDGSKRIRIPEPLLHYAGLRSSGPAVLVGTGRVTEIWSRERLDAALGDPSPEEEQFFESMLVGHPQATPPAES